jgi:hypothetical protein
MGWRGRAPPVMPVLPDVPADDVVASDVVEFAPVSVLALEDLLLPPCACSAWAI